MLEKLGQYRVEKKLADGGMGSVFLGITPDGKRVVLKVPHAQDKDATIALSDEARIGARLRHPAIVETLDFFADAGRSVLVVAFVDGIDLFKLRQKTGPLPAAAVAEIGQQLASALDCIHGVTDERGRPLEILHRDISPNNVLVDTEGQVRLIDLGIARSADRRQKSTMQGMVKGTLRYLAPEILQGGEHSQATDLWALGLTLWETALGRYAVPGDTMLTMRAALDGSITQLKPGELLDPIVQDVLSALVAPAATRLKNARAAANVLSRLAQKVPGGRAVLAAAVKRAMGATTGAGALAPLPAEATEMVAHEQIEATMLVDRERHDDDAVFARAAPAPTLQMSAADAAPTIQMPAAAPPPPEKRATTGKKPARDFDAATTLHMPMWTPAQGPPRTPGPAGTPRTPGPAAETPVDPVGPTRLQMPAAPPPVTGVHPLKPTPPPPAARPTPAPIPVATPAKPGPRPPPAQGPKESLFIPIVVVDDEDAER